MKSTQYTSRSVPIDIDRALRRRAKQEDPAFDQAIGDLELGLHNPLAAEMGFKGRVMKPGSRKWTEVRIWADNATTHEILDRVRHMIIRQATPPGRKRTCPRKVRQPVSSWPRLISNDSNEGSYVFEIISFP